MEYFIVDDNTAIQIEIWGFERIRNFSIKHGIDEESFKYFSGDYYKRISNRNKFKAVAAMHWDELVGIAVCDWVVHPLNFERYQLSFVDVKEEEQGKGIGTYIAKILNNAWFLRRNVLERKAFAPEFDIPSIEDIIEFDDDPVFFYERVLDRELKAEGYSIILPGYKGKAPKKQGIYNAKGERVRWSDEQGKLVPFPKR